jgi:hypothetical protein
MPGQQTRAEKHRNHCRHHQQQAFYPLVFKRQLVHDFLDPFVSRVHVYAPAIPHSADTSAPASALGTHAICAFVQEQIRHACTAATLLQRGCVIVSCGTTKRKSLLKE